MVHYSNSYPYNMNLNYNPYVANSNQNNGIIWVQGIEGARAYQIPPNTSVILMDQDNDGRFYIKVSDNVGMCSLRVFSYTEITNQPSEPAVDMSEYVKKSELQDLLESMLGGGSK